MYPLLTIIVPVYNVSKYLRQCIESILTNEYHNIEVIIVNDGSTDNSLDICLEYEAKDDRISVVSQENKGLGSARNIGLELAKGDYITFIDSDDYISKDVYSKNIQVLLNHPIIDVIQFPFYRVNDKGIIDGKEYSSWQLLLSSTTQQYKKWIVNGKMRAYAWNKIYKRSVWDNIRFPNIWIEDRYTLADIVNKGVTIYLNNQGFYYYRIREGQITAKVESGKYISSYLKADMHICKLLKKYKGLYQVEVELYSKCVDRYKLLLKDKSQNWDEELSIIKKNGPSIKEIILSNCHWKLKILCLSNKLLFLLNGIN